MTLDLYYLQNMCLFFVKFLCRYDLSIRDLRQEDSGRYECTATNAYGVTRRDVELKVIYGNHFLFIVQ